MTGVLFGLLGATLIGVSDCVARVTAQRVSMAVLLAAVMGLSTIALTALLAVTGQWPAWHAYGWITSGVSGFLNLVALYLLYTALARGPVSVASPSASVFSVLLVALNAATGAPFVWQQAAAILLVFLGVAMLARRGRSHEQFDAAHLRLTALFGLAAAVSIAARMFLAQEAGDALGPISALYLNRVFALAGVVAILFFGRLRSQRLSWPGDTRMTVLVLIQALLETLALASFLVGSEGVGRIGASIGFASFAAVTALTAWLWLGEPIGWRRAFWMAVVGCGIVIAIAGTPA
ncbi:MAG: EamA family transporter [Hyphomicrobiaceae bacterium]